MCKFLLAVFFGLLAFNSASAYAVEDCLPDVRAQLVTEAPPDVLELRCNLKLEPADRIVTQIVIAGAEASGVTLNCNGATLDGGPKTPHAKGDMLVIKSLQTGGKWSRPKDVIIRKCSIIGSMRIMGMGANGEATAVRDSSRLDARHVERVRAAAPTRIMLEGLTIKATRRTPLYLAPGVTHVTLTSSELMGDAIRTGIYLDAESAFNTIKSNHIHVTVFDEVFGGFNRLGPQISVDASSHNKILNNHFAELGGGGIYLYRNCGEGGTVRHGSPSHNQIFNNVFFYKKYNGDNPAVYLGAHFGFKYHPPVGGHCGDDKGKPWGSSVSNADHAQFNVVMQNQIFKHSASKMIKVGFDAVQKVSGNRVIAVNRFNLSNVIAFNDEKLTAEIGRPSGCYFENGYKQLLLSGESSDVFSIGTGKPLCSPIAAACSDGDLQKQKGSGCKIERVSFGCSVTGNNAGCRKRAACPNGTHIVASRAACNLESGSVAPEQLASSAFNSVTVLRPSDKSSEGICNLANTSASSKTKPVDGALDRRLVTFSCKEHDANGGDCDIAGEIYCR